MAIPSTPGGAGADWLVPDWPAPPGVWALCTTRTGGRSLPPYDSLNLGTHVGDDPAAVQANRLALQAAVQARTPTARAVFLNQVHGNGVVHLDAATSDGTEADACVATAPGAVCTIMVADCLPVLFAHASGRAVAAAHAGWRGLAGGVLEATVQALQQAVGPGAISAWLGPCIGPAAFEVGDEVREAFGPDEAVRACFQPHGPGKWLADLPALARIRLQQAGVADLHGNDGTPGWCTVTQASVFFSHRRDAARLGSTGRMAACIWFG